MITGADLPLLGYKQWNKAFLLVQSCLAMSGSHCCPQQVKSMQLLN